MVFVLRLGRDKCGPFSKKVVVSFLKNIGSPLWVLQKERKSGHWQVERLQFLKREQRGLRLRYAVIDLQPGDLQTAKFSCLLHHKGALIFQIKRPLFWKNARICPSLITIPPTWKKQDDNFAAGRR